MRVLIYSESEAAKARQSALRSEGHHASLRNPQFFNPAQFDQHCDLVIADDPAVLAAYESTDVRTEKLSAERPQAIVPDATATDAPPSPARHSRR